MNKALFKVFAVVLLLVSQVTLAANAVFDNSNTLQDVQDGIESLELRLDKLDKKINSVPQRSNLFNPGITAFGNFVACAGQGYPKIAHGLCDKPFALRELELDFRAAVDPWADAVFILAFEPAHSHSNGHDHGHAHTHHHEHDHDQENEHEEHNQGHHHDALYQVEIEEAYVTLKKWPGLDNSPLGIQLKVGRFRVPFGRFNQIHLHDLPQSTMPLSLQSFLGLHGLIRDGVSAQALIPTPGENNSLNLTLQILDSGTLPFSKAETTRLPSGLAHLAWFWDLNQGHDLEVGLSAYVEPIKDKVFPLQVYGLDANYKWKPFLQGDKHSFLLGGEFYLAPKEMSDKKIAYGLGGFGFAQYQFNQWLYLGVRYDYRHAFNDVGHAAGAFLTYYTTEFLRFRLGYEVVADIGFSNPKNNVMLEVNFVFGSHPVEPYWVNR